MILPYHQLDDKVIRSKVMDKKFDAKYYATNSTTGGIQYPSVYGNEVGFREILSNGMEALLFRLGFSIAKYVPKKIASGL